MQRSYPLRWLALGVALFATQCIDSLSDDCTKTLTCADEPLPRLQPDCTWEFPDGRPWQGGPTYNQATRRWRWPDGRETATQNLTCSLTLIGDAGSDAGSGLDCRLPGNSCDVPLICDTATGSCFECLNDGDCADNMAMGDAGPATACDLVRHECVPCTGNQHCSGDTPICKADPANSSRNECVQCTNDASCGGASPVCDVSTNECTSRCTSRDQCGGEKSVCNLERQLCVECEDNSTCSGATAQCNTTTNECVECVDDGPCAATGEVCDITSNRCVQCTTDLQCEGVADAPHCDLDTNLCVQCLDDQQCLSETTSRCNTVSHLCVGCSDSSQCENGYLCNTTLGGVCVQCLSSNDCNPVAPVCETVQGRCVECLDTSQCTLADAARCEQQMGPAQFTCVGCTTNEDCGGKALPGLCREVDGVCVDCENNGDCSTAALSRCNTSGGVCSVCQGDADCGGRFGGLDACIPGQGCVECVDNTHCANNDGKPVCRTSTGSGPAPVNTCVECQANSDCTSPTASRCVNNQCQPCQADAECSHLDTNGGAAGGTLGVCSAGTCVECTGPNRAACGNNNVCNSLTRQCTNRAVNSAENCGECVSDAECATNARCAQQTVGGATAYFCFPLQTNGSCTAGGFAQRLTALTPTLDSPGGELLCLPRTSTCPAYSNYINDQECDGQNDDAACGPGGACEAAPGGFACTIECISGADCRNTAACSQDGLCEL